MTPHRAPVSPSSPIAALFRRVRDGLRRTSTRASTDRIFLDRAEFEHAAEQVVAANALTGRATAVLVATASDLTPLSSDGHRRLLPRGAVSAQLEPDRLAWATALDPLRADVVDALAVALHQAIGPGTIIGVARSDRDGATIADLIAAASRAAEAARDTGRTIHWHHRGVGADDRHPGIAVALREALPRGEVVPYFEQQLVLATGELTGFEVLARWVQPGGVVGPDAFIPAAQASGVIDELSMAVMRQAFTLARDWDAKLTLSVNIAPEQLHDPWLAQKIIKVLTETNFPAQRCEIEITEAALIDNMALAQSIAASLKNQGMRLALDDFGTGLSSLSHLRAIPFDRLKIDRSLVRRIAVDTEAAAAVNAITRLGESLNLPVSAEGVEDAQVAARLIAMGCREGQGWHYGRPQPAAAARQLLAERGLLTSRPAGGAGATLVTSLRRAG